MCMGLIQSVAGLKTEKRGPLEKEGILHPNCLWTKVCNMCFFPGSPGRWPALQPSDLPSPTISQPIPDNKSFFLYIYTSYWFCFSGELYTPYNPHVKEKLLTDLLFFLFYLLKQSQRCSEFQEVEK